MRAKSAAWIIFALAFVGSLGPFSIDAYLPALPPMVDDLGASPALLQWTISIYLIGVAIFPLFLSPISDAVGRKPVMIAGLAVFIAISAGCALAPSIEALLALRLAQAAAGGAVMTTSRAYLADLYRGDALSRALSYVMLVFTIAPVVSPLIGAWLLDLGGWRWIFGALTVFASVALAIVVSLPETLDPARRRPYRLWSVLGGYLEISRSPLALRYLSATFCSATLFFAMLAGSPFIFIDHYGFSPTAFGFMFAAISTMAFFSNFLNARLVMRIGYQGMLRVATWFTAALAAAMCLVAAFGAESPWGVFAVMVGLMGAFQVVNANTAAGVLDEMADRAGAASASLALWRFVGGALGASALGLFPVSHPTAFAIVLSLGAIGGLGALRLGRAGG